MDLTMTRELLFLTRAVVHFCLLGIGGAACVLLEGPRHDQQIAR